MTGAVSLEYVLKFLVGQSRPPISFQMIPSSGWSFPSGHAVESAAVYLTLAGVFGRAQANRRIKLLIYLAALSCTFLIGVSRVYLGVHWPTDVIGGWVLGFVWTAIVLSKTS